MSQLLTSYTQNKILVMIFAKKKAKDQIFEIFQILFLSKGFSVIFYNNKKSFKFFISVVVLCKHFILNIADFVLTKHSSNNFEKKNNNITYLFQFIIGAVFSLHTNVHSLTSLNNFPEKILNS